jgi:membrane protein insertase Oxa1/YidC/SpoIIIJ
MVHLQYGTAGTGAPESAQIQKVLMYALPVVSLAVMAWMPGAVQLVFFSTSVAAVAQTSALRNPHVRKFFGLQPLPPKGAPKADSTLVAQSSPYKGTLTTTARVKDTPTPTQVTKVQKPSIIDSLGKASGAFSPGVSTVKEELEKKKAEKKKELEALKHKEYEQKRFTQVEMEKAAKKAEKAVKKVVKKPAATTAKAAAKNTAAKGKKK